MKCSEVKRLDDSLDCDNTRGRSFLNAFPEVPKTDIETKQKMNTPSIFLPDVFLIANPINPIPILL